MRVIENTCTHLGNEAKEWKLNSNQTLLIKYFEVLQLLYDGVESCQKTILDSNKYLAENCDDVKAMGLTESLKEQKDHFKNTRNVDSELLFKLLQ